FGFDVPVHVLGDGTFLDGDDVADAGIGDIRLSLKATIVKPWRIGPGIGLALDIMVPSGSKGGYGKDEGVMLMPKILLDAVTKHVHLMTNLFVLTRTEEFTPDPGGATPGADNPNVELHPNLGVGSEAGF